MDEFCRQMLRRLDGSHDREALGEAIFKAATEGAIRIHRPDGTDVPDEAERRRLVSDGVRAGLASLARSALLVA